MESDTWKVDDEITVLVSIATQVGLLRGTADVHYIHLSGKVLEVDLRTARVACSVQGLRSPHDPDDPYGMWFKMEDFINRDYLHHGEVFLADCVDMYEPQEGS